MDIPQVSCRDDTCEVADNIMRWNLKSLAWVAENMDNTPEVSSLDLNKTNCLLVFFLMIFI